MSLDVMIRFLWVAGMVFQALLVLVLLGRRSWKAFPLFAAYSLVSLTGALAEFAVQTSPAVYFYIYWSFEAVGVVLGFAVVYEVFRCLFFPHAALRKIASRIFSFVVCVFVIAGIVTVLLQAPADLAKTILVVEQGMRIVEVGLILFLFLSSSAFGLHWRQQVFGIALGLGLFVSVELISVTMKAYVDSAAAQLFSVIRIVAFCTSLLIWIGYLLVPERVTSSAELPKRSQLEQWNQAVMELIQQ